MDQLSIRNPTQLEHCRVFSNPRDAVVSIFLIFARVSVCSLSLDQTKIERDLILGKLIFTFLSSIILKQAASLKNCRVTGISANIFAFYAYTISNLACHHNYPKPFLNKNTFLFLKTIKSLWRKRQWVLYICLYVCVCVCVCLCLICE